MRNCDGRWCGPIPGSEGHSALGTLMWRINFELWNVPSDKDLVLLAENWCSEVLFSKSNPHRIVWPSAEFTLCCSSSYSQVCLRQSVCSTGPICWSHWAALDTTAVFLLVSSLQWPPVTPPELNQYFGSRPLTLKGPSTSRWQRDKAKQKRSACSPMWLLSGCL